MQTPRRREGLPDRRWLSGLVLIAPLLVGLSLVYILPFFGVAAWSVTLPTVGLGQYEKIVGDDLVLSVFLRTARISCTVTVLAVAAAYAITYVWVRGTRLQRRLFELCILVPFWISLLTRAFGWLALLSSRGLAQHLAPGARPRRRAACNSCATSSASWSGWCMC